MTQIKSGTTQMRVIKCISKMDYINYGSIEIESTGTDMHNRCILDFCNELYNWLKKSKDYYSLKRYDIMVDRDGFVWAGGWLTDNVVDNFLDYMESVYFN